MSQVAKIDDSCVSCGACQPACPADAIFQRDADSKYEVIFNRCCGTCYNDKNSLPCYVVCPACAIDVSMCGSAKSITEPELTPSTKTDVVFEQGQVE
jgi:Fe-S-cluster-containing hydrogenase component 2